MAISKKQVEHIALLARLKLSEKEKEKYARELSQILDFVEKLKEVKTEMVSSFVLNQTLTKNTAREDRARIMNYESRIRKLIEQAPEREKNFIKTKKIF